MLLCALQNQFLSLLYHTPYKYMRPLHLDFRSSLPVLQTQQFRFVSFQPSVFALLQQQLSQLLPFSVFLLLFVSSFLLSVFFSLLLLLISFVPLLQQQLFQPPFVFASPLFVFSFLPPLLPVFFALPLQQQLSQLPFFSSFLLFSFFSLLLPPPIVFVPLLQQQLFRPPFFFFSLLFSSFSPPHLLLSDSWLLILLQAFLPLQEYLPSFRLPPQQLQQQLRQQLSRLPFFSFSLLFSSVFPPRLLLSDFWVLLPFLLLWQLSQLLFFSSFPLFSFFSLLLLPLISFVPLLQQQLSQLLFVFFSPLFSSSFLLPPQQQLFRLPFFFFFLPFVFSSLLPFSFPLHLPMTSFLPSFSFLSSCDSPFQSHPSHLSHHYPNLFQISSCLEDC